MPKSASVYIRNILVNNLPLGHINLDEGYFEHIYTEKEIKTIADGFMYTHTHMAAKPRNLSLIKKYLPRMVVHVRDPRSTAVSLAHMISDPQNDPFNNFRRCSVEEQIDIQIREHIPEDIEWIQGWLDAENDPNFKTEIKFTRYDDLIDDADKFFHDILVYFRVDPNRYAIKAKKPEKEGESQFREGKKYGWRKDLTDEQKELALEMIPDHILDRFGWPRE